MKRIALTVAALLAVGAVNAQIYQWKDENGKTIFSDKPPVGHVPLQRKIESDPPATISPAQKTAADRELEFRKRQKEFQEKSDKSEKEQAASAEKKESCDSARRYLQALESGERIASRNDQGERTFMEDAQREQEIAKARQTVQTNCR